MGVREIDRSLEQWQMGVKDLRRRMILAPTPRERKRWYTILLLAQGWTAAATAEVSFFGDYIPPFFAVIDPPFEGRD